MKLDQIKVILERAGVAFSPGLTDSEFSAIKARYGFEFPPDLRGFLAFALPTGGRFPDWRNPGSQSLEEALAWPLEGLCSMCSRTLFGFLSGVPNLQTMAQRTGA